MDSLSESEMLTRRERLTKWKGVPLETDFDSEQQVDVPLPYRHTFSSQGRTGTWLLRLHIT